MIDRFMLIIAGLFVAGLVGSFFLYVSALALLATITIVLGLVGTLALGFWAGYNSSSQAPRSARTARNIQVINTPEDVPFLPETPAISMKPDTGMRIVASRERAEEFTGAR